MHLGRSASASALALLLASQGARASDACPAPPGDSRERRALAKEWFSRAEAAEGTSDLVLASKAYQCSMRMVPHAYTAYNLGRVSEKAGDLELALEAYQNYLKLAPEANDRAEVEGKVAGLKGRISTLAPTEPTPSGGATTEPPPAAPPVVPSARSGSPAPQLGAQLPTSGDVSLEGGGAGPQLGAVGWAVAGAGVAALAGGLLLNASARAKMSDCRSLAGRGRLDEARAACDAAPARAYGSYALFGLAAAAAVLDGVIIFRSREVPDRGLSLAPRPGGAVVSASSRF
jgi:tetratricopeptide (TPR) repeat protein